MTRKVRVYCGFPSTGNRSDDQVFRLRAMEKRYADSIELVYPEVRIQRMFHDYARNAIVEDFLNSNCDVLWFLDSDVVPPDNLLDIVDKHVDSWSIAGAPYPIFMTPAGYNSPQIVFTVYRGEKMAASSIPLEGTDFVEGVATGCLFIKREVFEKLEKPYFEFKFHPETRALIEGEDLGFCKKFNKLGYKVFVDFSLACDHIKNVSLLQLNNYAMQYAQASIANSDAIWKEKIAEAMMRNIERKQQSDSRRLG